MGRTQAQRVEVAVEMMYHLLNFPMLEHCSPGNFGLVLFCLVLCLCVTAPGCPPRIHALPARCMLLGLAVACYRNHMFYLRQHPRRIARRKILKLENKFKTFSKQLQQ